jgi:DNA topoisomerase VI subunit A
LLQVLKEIKAEDRAKIVSYLKTEAIEFIGECAHNVLFTNLGLKNKSHLKSQCDVKRLKSISNKNNPLDKKLQP